MKKLIAMVALVLAGAAPCWGWGPQGHRLVAEVAWDHLTPEAKTSVQALLGDESLADVSSWADHYLDGNTQTALWHYVNIPVDAAAYDRDRDCAVQPGVKAGSARDKWRDCAVDRIDYNEQRVADASLDRVDRAVALKFLVHFVGDLHQPFHGLGVERGGNGIPVSVFGSASCGNYPCNLHAVWDAGLIDHRHLDDAAYLKALEAEIAAKKMVAGDGQAGGLGAGVARSGEGGAGRSGSEHRRGVLPAEHRGGGSAAGAGWPAAGGGDQCGVREGSGDEVGVV